VAVEILGETSGTAIVERKQLRGRKLRIGDRTTAEALLLGKDELVEGKKKTKKSKVSVSVKVGL